MVALQHFRHGVRPFPGRVDRHSLQVVSHQFHVERVLVLFPCQHLQDDVSSARSQLQLFVVASSSVHEQLIVLELVDFKPSLGKSGSLYAELQLPERGHAVHSRERIAVLDDTLLRLSDAALVHKLFVLLENFLHVKAFTLNVQRIDGIRLLDGIRAFHACMVHH